MPESPSAIDHASDSDRQAVGVGFFPATTNAKIEKSAKDFESILLGSWLQQANRALAHCLAGTKMATKTRQGTVSGDSDAVVGAAMTNSGGIGIAR